MRGYFETAVSAHTQLHQSQYEESEWTNQDARGNGGANQKSGRRVTHTIDTVVNPGTAADPNTNPDLNTSTNTDPNPNSNPNPNPNLNPYP